MDNTQINWTIISKAIADGVIPSPIGSDENGLPTWEINGKQVTWQQIQQFLWEHSQSNKAAPGGGKGGIESGPQLSQMPDLTFERAAENNVERAAEKPQDLVTQPKTKAQSQSSQGKPAGKTPLKVNLIGQSVPLKSIDPTDPISIDKFVKQVKSRGKPKKIETSDVFLAEFFKRMLEILSIESAQ